MLERTFACGVSTLARESALLVEEGRTSSPYDESDFLDPIGAWLTTCCGGIAMWFSSSQRCSGSQSKRRKATETVQEPETTQLGAGLSPSGLVGVASLGLAPESNSRTYQVMKTGIGLAVSSVCTHEVGCSNVALQSDSPSLLDAKRLHEMVHGPVVTNKAYEAAKANTPTADSIETTIPCGSDVGEFSDTDSSGS